MTPMFGASFMHLDGGAGLDVVDDDKLDQIADCAIHGVAPGAKLLPDEFWRLKHRLEAVIDPQDVPLLYQAVQSHLQRPAWDAGKTDAELITERNELLAMYTKHGVAEGRRQVGSERSWLRRAAKHRAQHAYLVDALAQLELHLSGKAA